LRSRREARATDDRTSPGEEPAGEPVVYDYAVDDELGAPGVSNPGAPAPEAIAAPEAALESEAIAEPAAALGPEAGAEPEAALGPEAGAEASLAAEPEGVPRSGDPRHPPTAAALVQDEDEAVVVGSAPALADRHPAGDAVAPAGLNGTAEDAHVSGRHPAADIPLPRIVAIANQKGGVGKTTTAVNLGAALAELGFRTLIVDLDPQGNATTGLGVNARNLEHAIYDVLMHELPIDECIEPTSVRNLFVAPATIDLAGAEIELVPAFSRELRLRKALADT